jgi:hypothetical protein
MAPARLIDRGQRRGLPGSTAPHPAAALRVQGPPWPLHAWSTAGNAEGCPGRGRRILRRLYACRALHGPCTLGRPRATPRVARVDGAASCGGFTRAGPSMAPARLVDRGQRRGLPGSTAPHPAAASGSPERERRESGWNVARLRGGRSRRHPGFPALALGASRRFDRHHQRTHGASGPEGRVRTSRRRPAKPGSARCRARA